MLFEVEGESSVSGVSSISWFIRKLFVVGLMVCVKRFVVRVVCEWCCLKKVKVSCWVFY